MLVHLQCSNLIRGPLRIAWHWRQQSDTCRIINRKCRKNTVSVLGERGRTETLFQYCCTDKLCIKWQQFLPQEVKRAGLSPDATEEGCLDFVCNSPAFHHIFRAGGQSSLYVLQTLLSHKSCHEKLHVLDCPPVPLKKAAWLLYALAWHFAVSSGQVDCHHCSVTSHSTRKTCWTVPRCHWGMLPGFHTN